MTTSALIERIAQFENMAAADPSNEMAHFSLGNAYVQAQRADDAAASFLRCIEANADMSKAYQLAGEALVSAGRAPEAIDVLTRGVEVAAARGDMLPRKAIEELLTTLGAPVPVPSAEATAAAERLKSSGTFVCGQTGRPGTQLDGPPFRGPVGVWIHEHIAQETWDDWLGQGTKVINELHLDLSRDEDQRTWDQHMFEYLNIPRELEA